MFNQSKDQKLTQVLVNMQTVRIVFSKDFICRIVKKLIHSFLINPPLNKSIFISMAKKQNANEYTISILVKTLEIAMTKPSERQKKVFIRER